MKQFLLAILILFIFTAANAQYRDDNRNVFVSGGFELGIPSNTPFNISYGGSAVVEVKPIRQLGITGSIGYNVYNYKGSLFSGTTSTDHPALAPLKGGVKYYASPGFYASGELGTTISNNVGIGNPFIYTLGIGFDIPLDKHQDIELGFRYESYSQRQYAITGIRVAYRVGW